jgi:hypothetical protein
MASPVVGCVVPAGVARQRERATSPSPAEPSLPLPSHIVAGNDGAVPHQDAPEKKNEKTADEAHYGSTSGNEDDAASVRFSARPPRCMPLIKLPLHFQEQ